MAVAPGKPAAESLFKKQSDALNLQFTKLTDSAKVLEDKYTADEPKLTPAEKDKRQKSIGDFEQGLQAKRDEFQGQLEKLKSDLMQPLNLQVKAVIEEIRKAGGYTIIFDSSPSGSPIAAADKNLDLTDEAKLKLLQKADGTVKRGGGGGGGGGEAAGRGGASGGGPSRE